MRYYSDKTINLYSTVEELEKAEFALKEEENRKKILKEREEAKKKELTEQRKVRAAEVEEARKAMVAAQKKYKDTLEAFVHDYGSYHFTSTKFDDVPLLFDIFNPLFKTFL